MRFQLRQAALTFAGCLLLLSISLPGFASPCPTTNVVTDPVDFVWTYHPAVGDNPEPYYSGVMEVGVATFEIGGQSLTTRAYRQAGGSYSIPGPTIRVEPGNKYVLRFHNTLPYEPLNPDHNVFKDANVSNIHTHGLHISGEAPGDDVTRSFEGGFGGDFVWDIPADHMGGTYWYHAHHHGSTMLQVSGGLFGLLLVDDDNDGIPANVAAMAERQLVIGFLDPAAAGTGGDTIMSGTLSATWTVNGLVTGNVCMPPNTWEHWRVLLADRDARAKTIEFGPGVEVMLLARDGVWRSVAPKALAGNQIAITGASRADFAIRASSDSWISVDGTVVANIHVDGSSDPTVHPFAADGVSTWSATRPDYLRDLRNVASVNSESISMGARTINGGKFDAAVPTLTLPANQVQEWSVSGAINHPFHLHVYHVQALSDYNDFEAGEYYDVIAAKMVVRFDLAEATSSPYDGRTILHCHILGHEDQGAMGWLDVEGGALPPTYPLDGNLTTPYSLYYSVAGGPQSPAAPSNLVATALSSSTIDLTWSDNSANEDGFDIERSLNGVDFAPLASVGAGVVAFSDNNLAASTTYHYRVSAYNAAGNSGFSNVANATTSGGGGGTIAHVANIVVTRELQGKNRERGAAAVTIRDGGGSPVSGATVNGDFSGPTSGSVSGTTDANGLVSFTSASTRNPAGEWCFQVTNVVVNGGSYDAGANVVTQACESGPVAKWEGIRETTTSNFSLLGGYPNPFQQLTRVAFNLPRESQVKLEVFSVRGELVGILADGSFGAGQHFVSWNPGRLASGVYLLRLRAGNLEDTRRIVLMR